jgi:hypothetical protein
VGNTDVPELLIQVPPRRFWAKVGSEILAEGTKFNSGHVAYHWPRHPMNAHQLFDSMDEMTAQFKLFGWGNDVRIVWIDPEPGIATDDELVGDTWHLAGELADHGAAGCEGVGS